MSITVIRRIPVLFTAIVAVAAAWILLPQVNKHTTNSTKDVIIRVEFEPKTRTGITAPGRSFPDSVAVLLKVGATLYPKEKVLHSPWVMAVRPRRGEPVAVEASQVYGRKIECTITQLGNEPDHDVKFGPAQVNCAIVAR